MDNIFIPKKISGEDYLNKIINNSFYNIKSIGYENIKLCFLTLLDTFYTINNKNDLFMRTLNNLDMIIGNDTARNIFNKRYNKNSNEEVYGYFLNGFKTIDYINLNCEIIDPTIIIGAKDRLLINVFETFIHEFNHALSSKNNAIHFEEKRLISRVGIKESIHGQTEPKCIKKNNELNEFYNRCITDIIMNNILKFKDYYIECPKINLFLNSLNDYRAKFDPLVDPKLFSLLYNETLNELISYVYYNGNINLIKNYFADMNIDFSVYNKYIDDNDINEYVINKTKELSMR